MEFREIYCDSCKKVLARYKCKILQSEDMIAGLIQTIHVTHTRGGHHERKKPKNSEKNDLKLVRYEFSVN